MRTPRPANYNASHPVRRVRPQNSPLPHRFYQVVEVPAQRKAGITASLKSVFNVL